MNKWKDSTFKTKQGLKGMTDSEKKLKIINAFEEKKNIKEEISNFFSETSFTALTRIYKAQSLIRRLAWTIVVIAMMSWLGVQCFWLLDRYFRYPIEVKLDLKASSKLDFPSVTICNLNPIMQSRLDSVYTDLSKYAQPETSDSLFTATLTNWMFNESCDTDQYSCSNGRCIPQSYVCDGYDDCNNNDDEDNCAAYSCPDGMFKCVDNSCRLLLSRCDGSVDCPGGEDEVNCTGAASCPTGFSACATGGQCTFTSYICDGYNDCQDGSDEPATCSPASSTSSTVATTSGGTVTSTSGSGTGSGTTGAGSGTSTGTTADTSSLASSSATTAATAQSTQSSGSTGDTTQSAQVSTTQGSSTDASTQSTQASTTQGAGSTVSTPSHPSGRRKREASLDQHRRRLEAHSKVLHDKKKYGKKVNQISGIKKHLQAELKMMRDPIDRAQMVRTLQESYVKFMKRKRASLHKRKKRRSGKKGKSNKRRHKRAARSESSDDKSDFEIDWDRVLQNSTFNKWDALWSHAAGTDSYYGERDDEWEASMTYAYITAQLNDSYVEQSGHLKKNFIASCEFNGYQCSPSNFTFFHNHKYGNCYTINSEFSGNPTLTTRFQGPENGLKMELFINQEEYVANLATEAGARILIHKRGSMPFPEDNGITVMPGRSTSIGIKQMLFSRLTPPHGVCANEGEITDYYKKYLGTTYSKLSCLKSCYQNNMMELCGCAVPFYYVPPNVTVCNMLNNVTEKCVTDLPNVYSKRFKNCDKMCPQPCEETEYDLSISSSVWPSQNYESFLEQKLTQTNYLYADKDLDDDFTKIQIYYQDLIYTHIEQQKAYESMNLISDLGGQLGLWLGLSAITIGELCSFLFSVGRSLPSTWLGNTKTAPNDTVPISSIAPATLEDMYDDLCPDEAKYVPPDIITTKSNTKDSDV